MLLTHLISFVVQGEKRFMSDDLNKKLFKTLGAIELLEQDGVTLPEE